MWCEAVACRRPECLSMWGRSSNCLPGHHDSTCGGSRPTVVGKTDLDGTHAVIPTIKGKASLLGSARWTFDRNDPVDQGFLIA